ncbi:phospholipase D-like domain-containing protein [Neorhizobium vignae]|uniref:phospholipase D-like domain-containing protein n=1 Tax=Neorhizobium vignae TaxID=690585 RepID=UPI00068AE0F2|nr:phospholipase D-like domain-containing protein [Neorhizobium vignae]
MKILYLPVFRAAIGYQVSLGRRWSLLDHMLLVELKANRRSLADLASLANLPPRLVIESLINLLRSGWIEVRSSGDQTLFAATPVGVKRADEDELRPELRRETRYASLCMDRVTGTWLRTDDLELVYEPELPEDAEVLDPIHFTLNYDDPGVRDLIYLNSSEGFDGFVPANRAPSRTFARIVLTYDEVRRGLPSYAPLKLRAEIEMAASLISELALEDADLDSFSELPDVARDNVGADNLIVGGPEHLAALESALAASKTHIVIHSCFLHPEVVRRLLPDIERAAKRKVRVDLLWGLHSDPEATEKPRPIQETNQVLDSLPPNIRVRVQLSPNSSGSHAKAIVFDDRTTGRWTTIVGSCNFLSSWFTAIDVSFKTVSPRLTSEILSHLISAQLPASGSWPAVVRRLNHSWNAVKLVSRRHAESGTHALNLMSDGDHYACVTMARDRARNSIVVGCDLFGLAAETSVLVPMERAAQLGRKPLISYQRPSKGLVESGRAPRAEEVERRGIAIRQVPELHGKFLAWDSDAVAITSFNWLSTVVDGSRAKGAELGVLVNGAGVAELLLTKLRKLGVETEVSLGD